MAYEVPRTVYVLEFAQGTALAGATVKVRALSVGEEFDRDDQRWTWATSTDQAARRAAADGLHQLFLDHVTEWDLARDGAALPATLATLRELEAAQVGALMDAWYTAGVQVPAPLEQSSTDGEPSPEVSTMLAEASQSLAS